MHGGSLRFSLSEAIDHRELALISLSYLDGSLSSSIPIHAAEVHHHARWMAKTIYFIAIALFRDQLKEFFKSHVLASIQNLAAFISFFDVKFWLCSTNATDAPQLDLDFLKLLEESKTKARDPGTIEMVEAAYVRLKNFDT